MFQTVLIENTNTKLRLFVYTNKILQKMENTKNKFEKSAAGNLISEEKTTNNGGKLCF